MRSSLTWLIYAVCVVLAIDGLAWLTWRTVQAERSQREAQARVVHQQQVQLALWRVDTALAWMLRAESARPVTHYLAFGAGPTPAASPLLTSGATPPMRLYLAWTPSRGWGSPQAPAGDDLDRARAMGIDLGRVGLATDWLRAIAERRPDGPRSSAMARGFSTADPLAADRPEQTAATAGSALLRPRSSREAGGRGEGQPAVSSDVANRRARQQATALAQSQAVNIAEPASIEPLRGEWLELPGDELALLLLRDATIAGERGVVGVWVDWTSLRASLAGEVVDLLPDASISPIDPGEPGAGAMADRLALIPARVVSPSPVEWGSGWSGVSGSTWAAIATSWLAVISAVLAVGVVLRQVLALSARRARFAHAVSHELRTPLTALKLQADLMPESEPRGEVFREQVGRLGDIVESVLAQAGVRRAVELQRVPLGEVFDRIEPMARQRVERAGGGFETRRDDAIGSAAVECDPTLVQRVVMNLIDNAIEHAKPDGVLLVVSRASVADGKLAWEIEDNGRGVTPAERRRIFKPFVGGAQGGLGLGLPLARDAARAMGGELTLLAGTPTRFRFSLTLTEG